MSDPLSRACWWRKERARAAGVAHKMGDVGWCLIVFMHIVSLGRVKRFVELGSTFILESDTKGILFGEGVNEQ